MAAEVWNELVELMEQCGRLDEHTAPHFAYLCQLVAGFDEAVSAVKALNGDIVIVNTNGTTSIHPWEKIRQTRSRELAAALKEWGLS